MIETYFKVIIDEETEAENIQSRNGKIYTEISEMCNKLNQLSKENGQLKQRISELKEDNDHKFWKLQFMHQYNKTQLIVHEISKAIKQGYEVSDKFQEYLNELKAYNEKGREKAIEQEKWWYGMTENKRFKVMVNEQNKSACILNTKTEQVYMLAFLENEGEMNNYVINLQEVVDLLNGGL